MKNRSELREIIIKVLYSTYILDDINSKYNLNDLIKEHLDVENDFVEEMRSLIESSGIAPEQFEIEITESFLIDSADKALQCINELRAMGVKFAMDDFGTGYSSLSYLNRIPANLLKIDKSFIDKINVNESSKQYVAAIISMGHIMGLDVISEGVEEDAQLDALRSIGRDYVQGYIWGRPMSADDAEKLVTGIVEQTT